MGKSRSYILVAPVAIMILLASCGIGSKHTGANGGKNGAGDIASRNEAISVQSTIVTEGDLATDHVASGTVVPVTQSSVAARVSGIVKTVLHQAGTWVESNEVVVQLDDTQLKLAEQSAQAALESATVNLQKAKAQEDLAKLTLKRDTSLIQKSLIPQSQMDAGTTNAEAADEDYQAASAARDEAAVQLQQAELNLQYASIRAPFAGQIAAVNVEEGEFVGQNSTVFVLASPDREITFKVPPGDAAELSEGTPVTFSYRSSSYPAHLSQAPATPLGGVVPIVALFDPPSKPLPFGSIGSVSYRLSLGKGVIVPISSLQTSGNQEFVFAVRDGKAVKETLSIVGESGTDAATEGLEPGTRIILNPPPGLLDGSKVSIAAVGASNG